MKFSYDFDIDDWMGYQRHRYNISPTYRRMRNYSRMAFPVAALLFIFSHYLTHGFDPMHIGIFAAVSVAWFFLYPLWFDRRIRRNSNRLLREGNTSNLFGRWEVELLPDSVHIASSSTETTYRASGITKIEETADALLLYVSPIQAVILPRRKLSPEEFQQAAVFARQHYGSQAA